MKTLTVAGGDLYRIALQELGDATQAFRIARLNGLTDPLIVGVVSLRIPDRDPSAGGGVYGAP